MVSKEDFEEFNKKVRSEGLVMSRVPKNTRDLFVKIADEEFASDYGLSLKAILDGFIEYQQLKTILFNNLDIKLDYIINLLENSKSGIKEKSIRLLNGKKINIKEEQNEQIE